MQLQTTSSNPLGYFRARPWLVKWLAVFAVCLVVLGLTGQIHTQGSGWPTVLELSVPFIAVAVWVAFKFALKIDLSEEVLLGTFFGIQWEFLTEPYWTYLPGKFNILVWKDIPLLALMGWGTNFALALLFSEWIGEKLFKESLEKLAFDWRVLLCDAVSIQIIGTAAEWTYGIHFHGWDYALPFGIGLSPVGLGWEVHIGYMIVFFWYGTTMRVWRMKLEGTV